MEYPLLQVKVPEMVSVQQRTALVPVERRYSKGREIVANSLDSLPTVPAAVLLFYYRFIALRKVVTLTLVLNLS